MSFFIDDQQIQQQATQVEDSGQALSTTVNANDEPKHIYMLLSVLRAGKEEHKRMHKVELKAALHLGQYLTKKKASLKHGQYTPLLKEYGITTQDASRYCTIAEKWEEIKLKGYTDYSISTVLCKLREDAQNAIDGGYLNAVEKQREDYASEASGREAVLLRKLSDAEARIATERQANQQLQARLEEFQLNNSVAPKAIELAWATCMNQRHQRELLPYLL
jgi:hypothetical protein